MKFSDKEIQPLWDEVARIIGDCVMQMRHEGHAINTESLVSQLEYQLVQSQETERRVLLGAAINMMKGSQKSRCN
jgi:hypothetical protein